MSNLIFGQQDYSSYCRNVESNDAALDDCLTHVFHSTPVDGNTLGLYGMCRPEPDWIEGLSAHPSGISISNQIDSHITSESFSQGSFPSDSAVYAWQPHVPHYPFLSEAGAFTGVGDTLVPLSSQTITVPGSFPAFKPTAHSQSRHVAPRLPSQSTFPRHAPYPTEPDHTRQSASPTSSYQCHWSDFTGLCGAFVLATKTAIWEHLQAAHAIRLKADKTDQVCRWERCWKSMRRESIARHILAVHMQDKVPCPDCGSRFARPDSLQRHQRKQCVAKGETSHPCRAAK